MLSPSPTPCPSPPCGEGSTPTAFLRGWRGDAGLCCNPVIDWAATRGHAVRATQRALRRMAAGGQVLREATRIAAALELPATDKPREGDALVIDCPGHGPTLALCLGGGFAGLVDRSGAFVALRAEVLAAWEL